MTLMLLSVCDIIGAHYFHATFLWTSKIYHKYSFEFLGTSFEINGILKFGLTSNLIILHNFVTVYFSLHGFVDWN
jgi:hypothetical protein